MRRTELKCSEIREGVTYGSGRDELADVDPSQRVEGANLDRLAVLTVLDRNPSTTKLVASRDLLWDEDGVELRLRLRLSQRGLVRHRCRLLLAVRLGRSTVLAGLVDGSVKVLGLKIGRKDVPKGGAGSRGDVRGAD